ncbi:PREDICTED: hepatitis A virus cellular receptor 1 [Dipodomys ordii]|uniref:Hepatitis A virus cellular receptor 1 n=1 Tax=Dipodomys ordii TaxID=10020 RepID=A0A1S3GBX3_DIPOR|nr:PREDICTED: hepatitis A virus cellular receptor 1 [Dipodomys ordii]
MKRVCSNPLSFGEGSMLVNAIMRSQVVILSLVLFLTDAVIPSTSQVNGMVHQSVTLPCTYSVTRGVTSMCWGRGACPRSSCTDALIWTNGYSVTYRRQSRYQLKGQLAQGNVSLTIEDVTEADSGLYCCRVEIPGWFNDQKITLSLEVGPAPTMVTTVATSTRVSTTTTPTTTTTHAQTRISATTETPTTTDTQTHKTDFPTQMEPTSSIIPTQEVTSPTPTSAARTQPTKLPEAKTQTPSSPPSSCCLTDGNDTTTQSSDGGLWYNNQTPSPAQQQWRATMSGLLTGTLISSFLLLTLAALVMKRYFHMRKRKSVSLVAFKAHAIGALHSATEGKPQAEDNIYIIADNPYVLD